MDGGLERGAFVLGQPGADEAELVQDSALLVAGRGFSEGISEGGCHPVDDFLRGGRAANDVASVQGEVEESDGVRRE